MEAPVAGASSGAACSRASASEQQQAVLQQGVGAASSSSASPKAFTFSGPSAAPTLDYADLQEVIARLEREKVSLQSRLEFVEELVGPTEAQRKVFQDKLISARAAALRASHRGASFATRWVGRLDEAWLRSRGVSERDGALLQSGCLTGRDGISRDVSLLGDPNFMPYVEDSAEPRWDARGGLLRMSLANVRDRWGEDVALAVVRCARELDQYDGSRRLGIELPWHRSEDRELTPAEVINLLELELAQKSTTCSSQSRASSRVSSASHPASQNPYRDANSPSEMESVLSDFGSRCSTAMASLRTSRSATPVDEEAGGRGAEREAAAQLRECLVEAERYRASELDLEDMGYEWSFADADIQALLAGVKARSIFANAQAVMQDDDALDMKEEEALLELLEKECASGLLAPTPDLSVSSMHG